MEVTINLEDTQVEAIRVIGKDNGKLTGFLDSQYSEDITKAVEGVLVSLWKAIESKQGNFIEAINAMILDVTTTQDWMTFEKIGVLIEDRDYVLFDDPAFKDAFSADLIREQCRVLVADGELESNVIATETDEIYAYRKAGK